MSILVDALLKEKMISLDQLRDAKSKQIGAKVPLHDVLVDMGFVKEENVAAVASKVFNMPIVDLDQEAIDPEVATLLPYESARRYGAFPVRKEGEVLVLAMSDPRDILTICACKASSEEILRNIINRTIKCTIFLRMSSMRPRSRW
jgi:hypothetical protein